MSDRLELLPSLPPELKGKIQGQLQVEIGNIDWVEADPNKLMFRISFWGERSPGIILRSFSSPRESVAHLATYTIRCSRQIFLNYLRDMSNLVFDVLDTEWRPFGNVSINLLQYLDRDLHIEGLFPINVDEKTAGAVFVRVSTNFRSNKESISVSRSSLKKIVKPVIPD